MSVVEALRILHDYCGDKECWNCPLSNENAQCKITTSKSPCEWNVEVKINL